MEQTIPSNVRGSFELKSKKSTFESLFEHNSIVDNRRREQKNDRFWWEQ